MNSDFSCFNLVFVLLQDRREPVLIAHSTDQNVLQPAS